MAEGDKENSVIVGGKKDGDFVDRIDYYLTKEGSKEINEENGDFLVLMEEVMKYLDSKGEALTEEDGEPEIQDLLSRVRNLAAKDRESRKDADKEMETEAEKEKKLVWYEGIAEDLKIASNINKGRDLRTQIKQKMLENGIDIQAFIDKHTEEGDIDLEMQKVLEAAYILGGRYNPNKNKWGSESAALEYLRENLGIGREEEAITNYPGMKIDLFLAKLPNPRDIEGYEERVVRLAQAGVVI